MVPALAIAACGSVSGIPAQPAPSSTTPKLSGTLTVFAAASLSEAFKDAEQRLEAKNPGFMATDAFAGSQQLVANIQNGAPADVVATADTTTMQRLVSAGQVESPRTFARNTLAIAVARGNPRHVAGLSDLAAPGVSVVLADPSVPAGNLARQALQRAGVTVVPKSNELDVKSTLEKVESGDADAAIVYTTDVSAASGRVDGVAIPAGQNIVATYPIAVVRASRHHDAAAAYVGEAVSGDVQAALRRRGFLQP
jgi:molybdate transport system substrate-binding protein